MGQTCEVCAPAVGGAQILSEVTWVYHWNDSVFSFRCQRPERLRFRNGEFIMIGLMVEGSPLLRAYSIVSPNWAEHLEFLSIKVKDGPLTSHLQNIKVGDEVLIGGKPVGTLTIDDLNPGKRLVLLASGTGLAPFMAIVQAPETYEKFDQVVVYHSVRHYSDLAYHRKLVGEAEGGWEGEVREFLGGKLGYHPTVTQDPKALFCDNRRITQLIDDGTLYIRDDRDRAMICGSPGFLADVQAKLEYHGMIISPASGQLGDFVIERAFVD